MPIYEYLCPACGHEFEELVMSAASRDKARCPSCSHNHATRCMSRFSAHESQAAPACATGQACGQCCNPNGPCGLN